MWAGPEELMMTYRGPPDVGGDAKMLELLRGGEGTRLLCGPYNNYTDYSPLGKPGQRRT